MILEAQILPGKMTVADSKRTTEVLGAFGRMNKEGTTLVVVVFNIVVSVEEELFR